MVQYLPYLPQPQQPPIYYHTIINIKAYNCGPDTWPWRSPLPAFSLPLLPAAPPPLLLPLLVLHSLGERWNRKEHQWPICVIYSCTLLTSLSITLTYSLLAICLQTLYLSPMVQCPSTGCVVNGGASTRVTRPLRNLSRPSASLSMSTCLKLRHHPAVQPSTVWSVAPALTSSSWLLWVICVNFVKVWISLYRA